MTKITDNDVTSVAELDENNHSVYYLPHHGVLKKASLTTKLRVVFDASAKSEAGLCLNDNINRTNNSGRSFFYIGKIQKNAYVITADIAKMYRQILVTERQRDMQRILWRELPDQELQDYKLNTLTYGTSPASFIATRCLHELAFQNQTKFSKASQVVLTDFYMDDLITGASELEEIVRLREEIDEILQGGCFQLRKWVANNPHILSSNIDTENNLPQFIISDESCIKTLGLLWNAQ